MHIRRLIALSCMTAAFVRAADLNITYLASLLDQTPPCGVGCITTLLAEMPFGLPDPGAICLNETLEATAAACVFARCDFDGQKQFANVKRKFCVGIPIQNRAWAVTIVGILFASISVVAMALRVYSRYSIVHILGVDDWLACAAVILLIPYTVINIYNGQINGYGRHFWDLDPAKVQNMLQMFYVSELLYITTLTLVKSSILVFYFRVFPSQRFRIINLMTLCVVVMTGLAIFLCFVFQCTPIYGLWNPQLKPQCLNINTLAYTSGAMSVALDLIILILPLPAIVHLKMRLKVKLSLCFMFGLGSLACITAGIRLKYIVVASTLADPIFHPITGDDIMPALWSFVEICVALICSCLPALRALLSRWFPSIFDLTFRSNPEDIETPLSRKTELAHYHTSQGTAERTKTTFIEKDGPSYNKHSRVDSMAPSRASFKSSVIFPLGLSNEFPSTHPSHGCRDSETYTARVSIPPHGRRDSDTYTARVVSIQQSMHTQMEPLSEEIPETKVWINPCFDEQGNPMESPNAVETTFSSSQSRISLAGSEMSDFSLWALEGPRASDEVRAEERQEFVYRVAELTNVEELKRRAQEKREWEDAQGWIPEDLDAHAAGDRFEYVLITTRDRSRFCYDTHGVLDLRDGVSPSDGAGYSVRET
ncbi:uncharacterized protein RAG0_16400 [Rhynchosporium agropyri]|uniref:Uncharacterized protein n=1 Tax=Rhynchosporium agropyri TaxID=914238 RepID=A0A1E1LQ95_9HELO|nr:uncharacterized protein RAG0_16400 [Rhynchosporium agropyri]